MEKEKVEKKDEVADKTPTKKVPVVKEQKHKTYEELRKSRYGINRK